MELKQKQKKPFYKKWWFWVIAIIVVIGIAGSGGNKNSNTSQQASNNKTTTTSTQSQSESKGEDKKYSYDKFMKISMGMTYEQVKAILGEGVEESSSGDGKLKTVSYSWQNDDGSNISVMLQGNKVINKAQAFLQSMDANVTLDKYNKINNGMTYSQVKAILGEGQLISQGQLLGTKTEMFEWINSDGSNMNVTFQNGKVQSKAQFQLK